MTAQVRTVMNAAQDLDKIILKIKDNLSSKKYSTSKIIGYEVALLEIFNHEQKKLERLGYCDYEIAYMAYGLAVAFYEDLKKRMTSKTKDLFDDIGTTIGRKISSFEEIKDRLQSNEIIFNDIGEQSQQDSLTFRFNKLMRTHSANNASSLKLTNIKGQESNSSFDSRLREDDLSIERFKYREQIFPQELRYLLNKSKESKLSILLIDYREAKEFSHNHINHFDIINIEPSLVKSLAENEKLTDQDLASNLRKSMPENQYSMFEARYKYDLVVIYNFKYGYYKGETNRFELFKDALVDETAFGITPRSPFEKLVNLIMFRVKYISSRMKQYPVYLVGGVLQWHESFGNDSITKSQPKLRSLDYNKPNSRGGSGIKAPDGIPVAPYLKNFGEYLSSVKSNESLPKRVESEAFKLTSSGLSDVSKGRSTMALSTGPSHSTVKMHREQPTSSLSSHSTEKKLLEQSGKGGPSSSQACPLQQNGEHKQVQKNGLQRNHFLESYATGLTNLGNSCYMSCVIQCLGATPQLTNFFFPNIDNSPEKTSSALMSYRQHINVNNKLGTKGVLTMNFVGLLVSMMEESGKFVTPSHFKKVMGALSPGKQFATFDQQDCIEFLTFVLDGVHEDLNQYKLDNEGKRKVMELTSQQEKIRETLPVRLASTIEWERYLKLNFSVVVDYFQGQYLSRLRCLECDNTSTTYNAFSFLSLPIPEKLGGVSNLDLKSCIDEFVTTELLDDSNKWYCPNCKKFTKSTKKISITRLPNVLILHFKRFKVLPTGHISKLDQFIKYPVDETLDMTSYWPKIGTNLNTGEETITEEKERQILETFPSRNQVAPFKYKLYGVINHFGTLTTGHYTSYVRKHSDTKHVKEWCYFDDAKVTFNCPRSKVLNSNAYCLFYQRI